MRWTGCIAALASGDFSRRPSPGRSGGDAGQLSQNQETPIQARCFPRAAIVRARTRSVARGCDLAWSQHGPS
jgi:hypothetical protein